MLDDYRVKLDESLKKAEKEVRTEIRQIDSEWQVYEKLQ